MTDGGRRALALLLLCASAARAQVADSRDPEVAQVRQLFEYGKYPEALRRAQDRIDAGELSEDELEALHQDAGLAAFNLGKTADAERHLSALLRIDPDHTLDPFVYPPPAIHFFDKLREQLAPELDAIRREKRISGARRRAEEERRDQERARAELQRRQAQETVRKLTVRTVEKRSVLVNFVPFGAGQFQEGRIGPGVLLAASEAVLALASVVGYLADASLTECVSYQVTEAVQGPVPFPTLSTCGIRPANAFQAQVWRGVKVGAGVGFYALYGYGVVDALYHFESSQVTETQVDLPPGAPPPEPPGSLPEHGTRPAAPSGLLFGAQPHLFLTPGGAGAALTLHF